jgi:ribonucleotide reductase alpha subunit
MKYETVLSPEFLSKYKNKQPKWGFNGLGYVVYKRTYARAKEDGLTEEWNETVERCINGAQKIGAKYTKEEAERLYDHVFNLRCNFAGRMLWQLGTTTVDRFGLASLLNCWFCSMREIDDFCFLFEHLMLGGGVGFSVKKEDIHELPRIKSGVNIIHENTKDADFIVPDSRQGWVNLLRNLLNSYFVNGKSFTYSTILIRGSGEPIKGFGGTASGPKILVDGMTSIISVIKQREGKKLRSIDVLDICNIIGSVVVAGNVRRSAEVAIGDPDDFLYLRAKRWDLGNIPNWRAMSNNSIYADDFNQISDDVWEGYKGNGEPYGFMNLPLAKKYGRIGEEKKDNCEGGNPCQPEWAPVLTKDGIRQFKDINVGSFIWSETGWTQVINKWSTGIKKVYKYTTTAGIFYGTENHRIISNNEKIEVGVAESVDVLQGEYRKQDDLIPELIMDGLVLGDGTVHKASNNLVYLLIGDNDQDYFESEINHLIKKFRPGLCDRAYEIETSIKFNELVKTFNRSIPERFVFSDRRSICSFLRGLYSANGSVVNARVTLKQSSFKVIEQVQLMLSSIGIRSYWTKQIGKVTTFKNGDYKCKDSYDLNITTDRVKFFDSIGFIQEYKMDKLTSYINSVKQMKDESTKRSFNIISSELISEEEVYDLTVDNQPHTYWTGGLNVANCMEITLADGEACNLAEIYLNNISSKEELIDCAKLLYKTQKAVWNLPALYEKTTKIVSKNRRIGLGLTGICQSLNKVDWVDECYNELRKFDKEWSKINNVPESIKLTTVKPSGTLSLLGGSTPGVHPAYSRYYIRRVRMSSGDKLVDLCREAGYHVEYSINFDNSLNHDTVVVSFPCEAGKNTLVAKDLTAIDQLELVKKLQTLWADNSVSVTVYYKKEELPLIKDWLKENYKTSVKTVSFLLHSEHGFKQAPYQEIDESAYLEMKSKVKPISNFFDKSSDMIDVSECSSGACPIR